MNTSCRQIAVFLVCYNVFTLAYAQTSTTTNTSTIQAPTTITNTTSAEVKKALPTQKSLSVTTSIGYSQKIEVEENVERERGTDISLTAVYKINDLYAVLANTDLTQEISGPKDLIVSDTTVGFTVKGIQLSPELITTHSLTSVIPTSQTSQERDRLRTAVSLATGIKYSGDRISTQYKLSLTKNFHAFTQNANGTFLNEHRISNSISLIVPLTEKFSVSATGAYLISYTYENDPRYSFATNGDLNYDFSEKLSANLGMSTDGNALKPNGVESNINFYDERTSVFRTGVTYVY